MTKCVLAVTVNHKRMNKSDKNFDVLKSSAERWVRIRSLANQAGTYSRDEEESRFVKLKICYGT